MTNVYFNFNGSFGIDATSNQHRTNIESTSSQCRANVEPTSRDKLFLPHLWKHVAMIFAVLVMSMANVGMAWGATITINSSTTTSDALFPVSAAPTQYEYSSNSNIAGWLLIDMATSSSITITNKTGATITAVTAEGVAQNNSNKTVNFTISDGTTTAETSSGSWNNRKSSSLTSKALNSTNVGKLKCDAGQTYTITNKASSSYAAGVRFIITYTSTLPTALTNGATTSTTQAVSWTAPSTAPANGYLVAYSTSSTAPANSVVSTSGSYTVVAIAAGTTSTTLSDLTSGTEYYWWVRSKNARGNSSWVEGTAFTTTAATTPCVAPSSVGISGTWNPFVGETITLTATPDGGTGTPSYQWYKGGTAEGNKIAGATSATYTKTNCTFEDAGQYYCKVSTGADCSKFSSNFDVKMLRLYLFTGDTQDGYYDLSKTGTNTASVSISLGSSWNYKYYITDGCGHNYGNTGTMTSANCTNWTMDNTTNKCGITTTKGASYIFNVNCADYAALKVSVVYPSSVQVGGYNLYFANDERNWSNIHYRIGRTNWNSKAAMTLVPGTANLYQTTTIHYESDGGFDAWHIANNAGWSDGNSIYKTKTGDTYAITNATTFEGAPVPSTGLTVIPGSSHSTGGDAQNNNCEFYGYTTVPGMWTHNVSITAPTHGTITINYVDVNGSAQAFSSGNRDLAHTCIITVTAVPEAGYTEPATILINGSPYGNRDPYTLKDDIVVSVEFVPATYTVILNTNGGTINAGNVTTYTYGTGATLPTNVTKSGFTFAGWYDNAGLTGSAVTTISTTAIGNKEYWAKWTAVPTPAGDCGEIIKSTFSGTKNTSSTPSTTTFNTTGEIGGTSTSAIIGDNGKLNGEGAYLILKLSTGTFLAGDTIKISSDKSGGVKFATGTVSTQTYTLIGTASTATSGGQPYYFVLAANADSIIVPRTSSDYNQNPKIAYVSVCRPCPECDATPAAPTAFSNTAVTSTTATFSITDAGDAASYEIYTSTSSSTPTSETGTSVNSKTPTITGLTASTTYYAWVRSVCDASHKSAWVALTGSSFTTSAAAPAGDCDELAVITATSSSALTATVGSVTYGSMTGGDGISIDGYSYSVKFNSSGHVDISPKAGETFAAGDSLIVVIYNHGSSAQTIGFKIGSNDYTASTAAHALHYFRQTLVAANISDGKVIINRSATNGSSGYIVAATIKRCGLLPSCTPPELPSLSDQEVCAGNNGTAWIATISNAGSLATGETVSYEWKKKGSDAVLATTASYTPTSVTAADAGIYVVTATVSKTGNSDASASREVTLTVKFTATPMVTMTPSSVAPGETATLTASSSEGATFAWYSCDNAAGENPVNVASTATYTTPALAAGSHYYKVVATGDGTHTCGTAELIYQVEVAIPEQCHTYYWFPYAADAGTNEVTNNEDSFFSGTKTGSSNGGTYNFSVDGENLTATKNTGGSSMTITFTIPSGKTGTLGINCKGSSSSPVYLTHSSSTPQTLISDNSSYGAFEITDIAAGTYTVAAGASGGQSWTLCGMAVKVCAACDATTMDVSDAAPTYDMSVGGDFTEPTFTVKHNGSALSPQPALSYTSSNSAIATVNETTGALTFHGITGEVTITATFAGDGTYCASTGSYTLTINCGSEVAPKIVLDGGTNLAGCNTTITLHAKKQDGTDFVGGTYQWYRDGEAIDGATAASYVVARAGTYTVTRTGACIQQSTNRIVITNTETEPTVERLVPFQYYHEDKEYSDQMKNRHLFAVHSQGTHEGKVYSMTATRVSDDANVLSMVADALWVQSGGLSGVDTVMINLNLLVDKGLAAGDEVRFVCSAIACGGISPVNEDIILKVIDQTPTLAFICSGADGDGTRNKKNFKYNGDFLTGYNKADLCLQTGGTSFDKEKELPLYTELKEHYLISPVNGYAPFNLLNYEPFDLLLLTDYPKATVNDLTKNKLDSMYVLVDYRPMLSFKTHMVAKTPSSWAVKGFTTSPTVPKTSQTHMNIVCYAHPMFNALSHLATDEVSPDHDEEGQMVYKMLSGGGYDDSKGIQGFELSDAGNFVTIAFTRYNATASAPAADGTVTWTPGAEDRKLISACERQANIEARMILLSINADALCKLTEAGIAMVDSTLQYLLESDPLKVADCSLTFDDNNGTGVWSDEKNWAPRYNQVPNADLGARIIKPCTVDNAEAIALSIKIEEEGKLIIPATSALIVESSIRHVDGGILSAPSVGEISIAANAAGSGTLILNNITEDTRASVQMYSKASTDQSANTANWRWQYIGTPFNDVTDAMTNYYGSWLYLWNNGWTVVPKSGPLQPFAGYCITHPDGARTYNMTGTLATTADQTITVPAGQYMVIANSWTAPIQIDNFTDDDMKNLEARTIYFFNTGSDPNQSGTVQPEGVNDDRRWAAGTYVPVPIHSAPYTGDATIPAMQGFYVVGGASEGTLHLDYDRLVRPQKIGQNIVSGQMHAPRRVKMANEEPNVMKLFVGGNRYDDRLVLLEREDFTDGFDDGWDGDKWSGNSVAPSVWALREDNTHEAVSAIPEFEGTIIGFQAGEDSEYTFRFDYSGEADAIYLLDTETKVYTRVLTGNTYTFTTADNAEHQRFVLTRSDAPQVATGVDSTPDSSLNGRAKKLLIENKLYILLNGMLYDATGKVVR